MNKPENNTTEQELSLIDVLGILLEHWKVIGIGSFGVGLAAALIALLLPNKYEASIGLIIKQPEIQMTGEAPPLAPEMLTRLVESIDVKRDVFENLKSAGELESQVDFRVFQEMLSVRTQMTKGMNPTQLPVVEMVVQSDSPDNAAKIANMWGEIVVTKSQDIYTRGVKSLGEFIGGVFDRAEESRNKAEVELASTTLSTDLDLKKAKLRGKQTGIVALEEEILKLRLDIATNESLVKEIEKRVNEQVAKGRWIGEVIEQQYRAGVQVELASPTYLVERIDRRVRDFVEREQELLKYRKDIFYDTQKLKLRNLSEGLTQVLKDIESSSREYQMAVREKETLEGIIPGIPEKLVLNKAITDDPLWQAYLKNEVPGGGIPPLKTEESNPLYQEAAKLLMNASVKERTLQEKLESLALRRDELTDEISDLNDVIEKNERIISIFSKGILDVSEMLMVLRKDYTTDRQDWSKTISKLTKDKTLLSIKERVLKDFNQERETLAEQIADASLKLGIKGREERKMSNIADSLASKVEEIQLSKISTEQSSRSGTDILYQAAANPLKVSPRRTLIVLMAMLLAMIVLCGGVLIREKILLTA